jgi:hypothetical protein
MNTTVRAKNQSTLPTSITTSSPEAVNDGKISIYEPDTGLFTKEDFKEALGKLLLGKPTIRENKTPLEFEHWKALLIERLVQHKFTAQRLFDAVNRIIDGHSYPNVQISDIINYDISVTRLTTGEYNKRLQQGELLPYKWAKVNHNGQIFYTTTEEARNYNLAVIKPPETPSKPATAEPEDSITENEFKELIQEYFPCT